MLKVFHMADMHLGTDFAYLDKERSAVRKNEIRLSFYSQIEKAYNKGVRVFLLSGDIFDSTVASKEDTDMLCNVFMRFSDCNFFVCFGNHDYLDSDKYSLLCEQFGENVYIFNHDIGVYEFDEYRVYGISFCDAFQENSLLDGFVAQNDEKINIMVIHGDIVKGSKYNPILTPMIEESGLDYLALGHVHMYSGVNKLKNTYYCYPGTHEGKGFDELGDKGGVYLEIEKGSVSYEFMPGCVRKHIELHINAGNTESAPILINKIISQMDDPKNLYKIIIEGEISRDLIINPESIAKTLEEYAFFVKVYDQTELMINPDDYLEENSLLGGFVREVKKKLDDESQDNEHWQKVLKKGFQLLK